MCYNKGKVLIIAAPSGSGKTTIAKFLISKDLNLVFSISACNRKKRQHEIDGVDYFFLKCRIFSSFNDIIMRNEHRRREGRQESIFHHF